MPVYQITLFVCEKCGGRETTSSEELLYSDPVIGKEGWTYGDDDKLLCPLCASKTDKP